MHSRRLLALVIVFGCAGLVAAPSPATAASPPRAPTLFVLRGPARSVGGELTVRTRSVEWFTDRPERRAGTMTPRALVRGWRAWGFADDPPNAALTGHDLDVVVELSAPRVRDGRLRFDVAPVRGRLPRGKLGAVSAFVDATSTETTSTVQIVNDSGVMTTAFVYVVAPGYDNPDVQPLTWLTTQLFPNTRSSLEWDTSTQLMWAETGAVVPGITFDAQQTLSMPPVGPGQTGTADLTLENGNYSLTTDTTADPGWGTLAVETSGSVNPSTVAVALGLSGSPALIAPAYPDYTTAFPVVGLTYWLSSSEFLEPGQVLDGSATLNAVRLNFTLGVTSLTATLNANGSWTVQPS